MELILVQDTKKPNREPFEVSQKGFEFLQSNFGNRYKSQKQVIVTPDKIEVKVIQKEIVHPAKTIKGR